MLAFIGRGGSGKTALSALSAIITSLKRNVVLIDGDPTTAKLTSLFFREVPEGRALVDYIASQVNPSDLLARPIPVREFQPERGKVVRGEVEKLRMWVVPNRVDSDKMLRISEMDANSIFEKMVALYDAIMGTIEDPLIVLDTPAGAYAPVSSYALALASTIKHSVVIVTPDRNTIDVTAKVVNDFKDHIRPIAVVLNWFDRARPFFYLEGVGKPVSYVDYVIEKFGMNPIVVEQDPEFRSYMSSDSIPLDRVTLLRPTSSLLEFSKKLIGLRVERPTALIGITELEALSLFKIEEGGLEELEKALEGPEEAAKQARREITISTPVAAKQARREITISTPVAAKQARREITISTDVGDARLDREELLHELRSMGAPEPFIEKLSEVETLTLSSLTEEEGSLVRRALVNLRVPVVPRIGEATEVPKPQKKLPKIKVEVPKPQKKLPKIELPFFRRDTLTVIYPNGSSYTVDRRRFLTVLNMFGLGEDARLVKSRTEVNLSEFPSLNDPKFRRILSHFNLPEVKQEARRKRKVFEE
ncbi:MAG: hypothetical protein QXK42_07635 [Candidatus Korarchaeum sp.]